MNALIPCWRHFGTIQRMPRMTSCSRGDVVLVKFVFADEKGAKQRPGLIVSIDRYHQGRREMILAAITSNVGRLLVGDYKRSEERRVGKECRCRGGTDDQKRNGSAGRSVLARP